MNCRRGFLLLIGILFLAVHSDAVTITNVTTTQLLFSDDFESAPGVSNAAYLDTSGDYDPVPSVGTWFLDENDGSAEFDIQVTNVASNGVDPGPIQGSNYLRMDRSMGEGPVRAEAEFDSQTTVGNVIRVETMFATPESPDNRGNFEFHAPDGTQVFRFTIDGEDEYLQNIGAGSEVVANFTSGAWNHLVVDYEIGSDVYSITLNGKTYADIPAANPTDGAGWVRFSASARTETELSPLYVDAVPALPEVTIDRISGNISLANTSGEDVTIVGYSLLSRTGTLDRAAWTSIAENYDVDSGNPLDNNDEWVELGEPDDYYDMSEMEVGPVGDGLTLASGGASIDLGDAWLAHPSEDVEMELLLDSGAVVMAKVTFTGGSGAYPFGDLDFDYDVDTDDFELQFLPNYLADTSEVPGYLQYRRGDLNQDGIIDALDFLILNEIYLEQNPGAAALSLNGSAVPEGNSLVMLLLAGFGSVVVSLRNRFRLRPAAAVATVLATTIAVASGAHATLVRNLDTDELLFFDDYENAPNGYSTMGYADNSGDYDPSATVGTWDIDENGDDVPYDIQVTEFVDGIGVIEGSRSLRIARDPDASPVRAIFDFDDQTTAGEVIRFETMFATGPDSSNRGNFEAFDSSGSLLIRLTLDGADDHFQNYTGSFQTIASYTDGEWHHFVVDYEIGSSVYSLTVDGTLYDDIPVNAVSNNLSHARFGTGRENYIYLDAVPIPEPRAIGILAVLLAGAFLVVPSLRNRIRLHPAVVAIATLATALLTASSAQALKVENLNTDTLLFYDDFESAPNGFSTAAYADTSGDYNPVASVGTWDIDENGGAEAYDIQVTEFVEGIGVFEGNRSLRITRASGASPVRAILDFDDQSTANEVVRFETMFATGPNSPGRGNFEVFDSTGSQLIRITLDGADNHFQNYTGSFETITSYTDGEWHHLIVDYAIGSSEYSMTVDGNTFGGIPVNAVGNDVSLARFGTGSDNYIYLDRAYSNELTLQVDRGTGEITLINNSGMSHQIDLYRITSELGSLTPNGWDSLQDKEYDSPPGDPKWSELGGQSIEISEGAFGESTLLPDNMPISLGNIYNFGLDAMDLQFDIHFAGTPANLLYSAQPVYIGTPPDNLLGDFNADGMVNLADYTVWRNNLGATTEDALNGAGSGDGVVDAIDYALWRENFGETSVAMLAQTSVPEPGTVVLLSCLMGCLLPLRRQMR